jgi:hypothetical protein
MAVRTVANQFVSAVETAALAWPVAVPADAAQPGM